MIEKNVSPYVVYRSSGSRQTIPRQTKYKCQMVVNAIEKHKLGQEGKGCQEVENLAEGSLQFRC